MGYKIKDIREELHMTQEELAERSGVCRTIISKLENDAEWTTSTKTLLKIARALGRTVDQIFFDKTV